MSLLEQNDTNTTVADSSAQISVAAAVITFTILDLALVLECLVGAVVALDWRRNPSVVKQLLLALILSDLLGILNVNVHVLERIYPPPGTVLCFMCLVLPAFSLQVSGFIAATMAVERCLALKAPFWYKRNISATVVWIILLVQSFCSLFISILPIIGLGSYQTIINGVKVENCNFFPNAKPSDLRDAVFTLTFRTVVAGLFVVVVSCNVLVMREMKRMQGAISWPEHIQPQRPPPPESRMTRMLLALSVTFVICWIPLIVTLFLIQAGIYIDLHHKDIVFAIASLSFIIDSGLYFLMNKRYRENIRRICCRGRPGDPLEGEEFVSG